MEKVQDDGARGGTFGQLLDGRLRDLILRAADGWLPGVALLITSRFRLFDPLKERSALYRQIDIDQLQPPTALALLRARGVHATEAQLLGLAEESGFHALTLDLLGGYVAAFCDGDPARLPPLVEVKVPDEAAVDEPRLAAVKEQERRFGRLAQRYREALAARAPAALALLERVCLFRLGVDTELLASVFTGSGKNRIAGPDLATLNRQQVEQEMHSLSRMHLIEEKLQHVILGTRMLRTFTVHPAVRDGFLQALDRDSAMDSHAAIIDGLSVRLGGHSGRGPRDRKSLDLIEEIIHHTVVVGRPQEAWNLYCRETDGFDHLGVNLGEFERGRRICMEVEGSREADTILRTAASHECALFSAGCGRLHEAIARIETDIATCRTDRDPWFIGKDVSYRRDLGLFLWTAGKLRSASERLKEAGGDISWIARSCQGHVHASLGDIASAEESYRAAREQLSPEERADYGALYGLAGVYEAMYYVHAGRFQEALDMASADLRRWSQKHERDAAYWELILAEVHSKQGALPEAKVVLEEGQAWALANDAKELLCWSALIRAKIQMAEEAAVQAPASLEGAFLGARKSLCEGLRIAHDCGYGIYHIDLLLERARLHLLRGEPQSALDDLRVALDDGVHPPPDSGFPTLLAATDPECGYAWGIAEGGHLRAQAFLLQAAQALGRPDFAPANFKALPAEARSLIESACKELEQCRELRKRIQDPKLRDTEQVLEDLDGGLLTVLAGRVAFHRDPNFFRESHGRD